MKIILSVTAGPAKGQSFTFSEPDCFLFGRTKDARISLPNDPYVSRQHFLLEVAPPNCRVTDLESKNGTFVNGTRYGGRKAPDPGVRVAPDGMVTSALKDGDEVVVGDTRLKVLIDSGQSPVADDPAQVRTIQDSRDIAQQATLQADSSDEIAQQPTMSEGSSGSSSAASAAQRTIVEDRGEQQTQVSEAFGQNSAPLAPGEVAAGLEDAPVVPGYRIERVLGQGGMGKVYKGTRLATGRVVAIKALLPNASLSFNSYRSFHREIEVTRQLKHANIVQFIDVGKTKGALYCILEFISGMDLRAYVKSCGGKVNLKDAAPIMLGTLDGLAHAHRTAISVQAIGRTNVFHGIVHRDLKPENILLEIDYNKCIPKVADFGLSKSFESAGMTDMTMGGVAGTPAYWPREQITHYRYLHPATDVFSIGAVFYEMLTGDWARPGLSKMTEQCRARKRTPQIADFIRVIGENPIKPIRSVIPSIPAPVAEVLDRALYETEVPTDEANMRKILADLRFPDAGEFRDALARALKVSGISA